MTVKSKWIKPDDHTFSEEELKKYTNNEINNIKPSDSHRKINIISITSYLDYLIIFYEENLII